MSPPSGTTRDEHTALGMPSEQPPRPGLARITRAGDDWAAEKLAELDAASQGSVLIGARKKPPHTGMRFNTMPLINNLPCARAGTFLAEHEFSVTHPFKKSFGLLALQQQFGLALSPLRPDLIEVRPAGAAPYAVELDGSLSVIPVGDARLQLRIIDIKLSSEPGPGYFAEVVYYSIALAGWLIDAGLDQRFLVSGDPAIWPGSHDASNLVQRHQSAQAAGTNLTPAQVIAALNADLIDAPFEVFAARLRHFFTVEIPEVLATPWQQLPFEVSTRCRGCEYLGQRWGKNPPPDDPGHCIPTAETTDHLSQIPFISRGAGEVLREAGTIKVAQVAALPPSHPQFDRHHTLRGQRTVIAGRANTLSNNSPGSIPQLAGTSAVLPGNASLRVYVTADFDASSAISLVFGLKAWWWEPTPFGTQGRSSGFPEKVFVVDQRSVQVEERELLEFLREIDRILQWVRADDAAHPGNESTVQFYVWDELTYRHLTRVVGRHLSAILREPNGVRALAWLFPPETVLPNAALMATPAISIVNDPVRSLVALPVPYHYSLLETARNYPDPSTSPQFTQFRVPSLFEDPLSDQIPSERAHDIWTRAGGKYPWGSQLSDLVSTVRTRLRALEEVTKRLRTDLKGQLRRKAPRISAISVPSKVNRLTADELLLLAFTKLNQAVDAHENARIHAMPPHEREARFASARLTERLTGSERLQVLHALNISASPTQEVYHIRKGSCDTKVSEGDFTWALVPEARVELLDWNIARLVDTAGGIPATFGQDQWTRLKEVLQVTVIRFARDSGLAVVDFGSRYTTLRNSLLQQGFLNLNRHVSLERISKDFFTPKLEATLQAIGKTPKAVVSPVAVQALGQNPKPRTTASVPVEDVLWDAATMSKQTVPRSSSAARAALTAAGYGLNQSQWAAFDHALTHRLSLLWGPPGTGKSRTLTNIAAGAVHDALSTQQSLRVLICSYTYAAIDNLLKPVADLLAKLHPRVPVWRLRSDSRPAVSWSLDLIVSTQSTSAMEPLLSELLMPGDVSVVGGSPQQVHKLAVACGSPVSELFDLIIIDEASQMDVASATLPLATLARHGALVVAGDPLQLPPIHRVDPPLGTEALVGSLYAFLDKHHGVAARVLNTNYRSNQEIVSLALAAKYPAGLRPNSPHLRINLVTPIPTSTPPTHWPSSLAWSPYFAELLDPKRPVTCFVHPDSLSGQSNEFEAQTVTALSWLLCDRLADQLGNEIDQSGQAIPPSQTARTLDDLLATGLGVVTPHRAQVSNIVRLLGQVFPTATPALLRGAVDSVERYQGQERDVMIASYAVGDPDTIADEAEFLQSLERFNVMVSRARAKVIVFISETLVQHLPFEIDVLRASALLKSFAETLCQQRRPLTLPWMNNGVPQQVRGSLRYP